MLKIIHNDYEYHVTKSNGRFLIKEGVIPNSEVTDKLSMWVDKEEDISKGIQQLYSKRLDQEMSLW